MKRKKIESDRFVKYVAFHWAGVSWFGCLQDQLID
jgi:hypothetical protein